MKIGEVLLEANVHPIGELNAYVQVMIPAGAGPAIQQWFLKTVRNYLINNPAWHHRYNQHYGYPTRKLKDVEPEWAHAAHEKKELVYFYMNPELHIELTNLGHYLIALQNAAGQEIPSDSPNKDALHQQKVEAQRVLGSLLAIPVPEMFRKAQEYYARGSKKANLNSTTEDKDFKTVLTLEGGWKWVLLTSQHAYDLAGKVLQNCIGDYYRYGKRGSDDIFLLIDPANKAHVAARGKKTRIEEIRGKQNKTPAKEYRQYCIPFVQKMFNAVGEYADEDLRDIGLIIYKKQFFTIQEARKLVKEVKVRDVPIRRQEGDLMVTDKVVTLYQLIGPAKISSMIANFGINEPTDDDRVYAVRDGKKLIFAYSLYKNNVDTLSIEVERSELEHPIEYFSILNGHLNSPDNRDFLLDELKKFKLLVVRNKIVTYEDLLNTKLQSMIIKKYKNAALNKIRGPSAALEHLFPISTPASNNEFFYGRYKKFAYEIRVDDTVVARILTGNDYQVASEKTAKQLYALKLTPEAQEINKEKMSDILVNLLSGLKVDNIGDYKFLRYFKEITRTYHLIMDAKTRELKHDRDANTSSTEIYRGDSGISNDAKVKFFKITGDLAALYPTLAFPNVEDDRFVISVECKGKSLASFVLGPPGYGDKKGPATIRQVIRPADFRNSHILEKSLEFLLSKHPISKAVNPGWLGIYTDKNLTIGGNNAETILRFIKDHPNCGRIETYVKALKWSPEGVPGFTSPAATDSACFLKGLINVKRGSNKRYTMNITAKGKKVLERVMKGQKVILPGSGKTRLFPNFDEN